MPLDPAPTDPTPPTPGSITPPGGQRRIWRNGHLSAFDLDDVGLEPEVLLLAGPDDREVVPVSLIDPAGSLLHRLVPLEQLDALSPLDPDLPLDPDPGDAPS